MCYRQIDLSVVFCRGRHTANRRCFRSLRGARAAAGNSSIKDDIHHALVCACDGVAFRHEPFCEMAKAEIPNKLLRSYTGTRFVFSS